MSFLQGLLSKWILIFILGTISLGACNRGYGCPTEEYHTDLDKKGNPKKKPTSGLWDKKQKMYSKGNPKKSDKRNSKNKKRTN